MNTHICTCTDIHTNTNTNTHTHINTLSHTHTYTRTHTHTQLPSCFQRKPPPPAPPPCTKILPSLVLTNCLNHQSDGSYALWRVRVQFDSFCKGFHFRHLFNPLLPLAWSTAFAQELRNRSEGKQGVPPSRTKAMATPPPGSHPLSWQPSSLPACLNPRAVETALYKLFCLCNFLTDDSRNNKKSDLLEPG